MEIVKVFNNNVVLARLKGQEMIVMGKGLGFQKKKGDKLDQEKVEKTFILQSEQLQLMQSVYSRLSSEETNLVLTIISYAEEKLKAEFQPSLFIALADHLHFAYERQERGLRLANPLTFELQKFYGRELQVSQVALQMVKEHLGVTLDPAEASFVALHLINAQKESPMMAETLQLVNFVQEILKIVKLYFRVNYDESAISYHRFITHLNYFAQRVQSAEDSEAGDDFLYEQVKVSYPEAF